MNRRGTVAVLCGGIHDSSTVVQLQQRSSSPRSKRSNPLRSALLLCAPLHWTAGRDSGEAAQKGRGPAVTGASARLQPGKHSACTTGCTAAGTHRSAATSCRVRNRLASR